MLVPPAYVVRWEGSVFPGVPFCLNTVGEGGTSVSGPRSVLQPLVPGPFWGRGTPASCPRSCFFFLGGGGYPGQVLRQGNSPLPLWPRLGYPPFPSLFLLARTEVPPSPARTGYAAGGMPLAISHRTFLFYHFLDSQIFNKKPTRWPCEGGSIVAIKIVHEKYEILIDILVTDNVDIFVPLRPSCFLRCSS